MCEQKRILLIDDDLQDLKRTKEILDSMQAEVPHVCICLQDIRSAESYLNTNIPDLMLLDLEFQKEHMTSVYLLGDISPEIPVIIISNLLHYQRSLTQRINVKGFIPKSRLDVQLPDAVLQVLKPRKTIPDAVIFPAASTSSMAESISIRRIIWLEQVGRRSYRVYLNDGKDLEVKSVPFTELLKSFASQRIEDLKPVSRGQMINTGYIHDIFRERNGRIFIAMVSRERPYQAIRIGKAYEKYFVERYL